MATSYKTLKEDFVSNLTGGRISEVNLVTAVAPSAILLWSALQSRHLFFTNYTALALAVDFLLNVGALLLSTSLYASSPLLLNLLLIAPTILVYAFPSQTHRSKKARPPSNSNGKIQPSDALDELPKKPFLTVYRGGMMVITCLCILAVDFRIFPRRFAKVETWGTSLMDMGVGSFVFSGGLVAARPVLKEKLTGQNMRLGSRLYSSMRHSIPLLVLGLVRLYSVKGLDYAEHVTEYGVHWNFFFTLGFLPPFVAAFQTAFQLIPSYAVLAILLGTFYQAALEFTYLKAFVLTAPRMDLFSQNREGIVSFWGYLAIFLAGQATGMYVIPRQLVEGTGGGSSAQRKRLLVTLLAWVGIWTLLYFLVSNYRYGFGLTVSRRLANLPYVLWVAAFNCAQITAFCVIETIFFPGVHQAVNKTAEKEAYIHATSKVLGAYNRNGLPIFLLANLLTGLINLTIPTLDVGDPLALGILLIYGAVLTGTALLLDIYNIDIKL